MHHLLFDPTSSMTTNRVRLDTQPQVADGGFIIIIIITFLSCISVPFGIVIFKFTWLPM